jgi:tryptophanyl-tRNA synthetase
LRIDPWSSAQYEDYARLRDEFGIQPFDPMGLPNPCKLLRRGAIFGHRGFELIKDAILSKKRFVILTGLMPSGNMHLGNKMVMGPGDLLPIPGSRGFRGCCRYRGLCHSKYRF